MGIREKLNDNPRIAAGATAAIILVALGFIGYQLFGGGPEIPTESWYTIDDGATYFADDITKIAPFDKDGQQAVRCHVFTCNGGEPFVAYLERYTPEAKIKMEEMRTKGPEAMPDPATMDLTMNGVEVKKPKDPEGKWIKRMDFQKAAEIMQPKCPDGTAEGIEPYMP